MLRVDFSLQHVSHTLPTIHSVDGFSEALVGKNVCIQLGDRRDAAVQEKLDKKKEKTVMFILHVESETVRSETRKGAGNSRPQSAEGSVPSLTPHRS